MYTGSHDDSSTPAGYVPSDRFPFGAKPREEAAPPSLNWLSASAFLPLLPHVRELIDLPALRRLPWEVHPQVQVLALIWSGSLTAKLHRLFRFLPMNT